MSESMAGLRRKIGTADDLHTVVRTMKAMAASSIGQYENAIASLDAYNRAVQLGLAACLRREQAPAAAMPGRHAQCAAVTALVFGSDQGMVGQFNDAMLEFVKATLAPMPGSKTVLAVGERIAVLLAGSALEAKSGFALPMSIRATAPLVGQLLIALEPDRLKGGHAPVYVFHHRPMPGGAYAPVCQRLLPLDDAWQRNLVALPWPSKQLPEVLGLMSTTLAAFVSEYLFVTLFRACAESQASENASRLAAMQRAEKNIDELLGDLNRGYHRLRQSGIDDELFDLVGGFATLSQL